MRTRGVDCGRCGDWVSRSRSASESAFVAADVAGNSVDLFSAERDGLLTGRVAWVFGNEAHGLPAEVLDACEHVIRIPILGRAESLNLATAAAVCLYAGARQPG